MPTSRCQMDRTNACAPCGQHQFAKFFGQKRLFSRSGILKFTATAGSRDVIPYTADGVWRFATSAIRPTNPFMS